MCAKGGDGLIEGRALSKRKKGAILTNTREGGVKGRGVDNIQEDDLGELDAAVNTFIQFPKLRAERQYA